MGNNVQKVLQGRGDKKRQGFWIKAGLPFLLLFLTYLGLLFEFPLKKTGLWFVFSITTIVVYAVFHIVRKEKKYALEFLISLALFLAGMMQTLAIPWLKMTYFPFMIFLTAFYGQKTILSLLLLIPFLELNSFFRGDSLIEEIVFILSLVLTVSIMLLLKKRMKPGYGDDASAGTAGSVSQSDSEAGIRSYSDEKIISHYLETMFKPEEEIMELLTVAKNTVFADSVTLFMGTGGSLKLRSSTDESGGIIPSDGGIINLCFADKKSFISSDISEKKLDAGYLKREKISSLISVPVMDDSFPLGVLTADSGRFHAFTTADRNVLEMLSKQIVRILQRERVYPQIQRSYAGLKILNEESSKLLSSLNVHVILKNLSDGAGRIASSEMIFFMPKGREFEIVHQTGSHPQEKKIFSFKGTLLDMATKNREPVYISDVKTYGLPVLPFKTDHTGSVFVLPLIYERELLGIFALLFDRTNALSTHQIQLLEVLGNQASTSIANAKFHEEIERLAVTDGLTGLFNHRHFQERLSQELKRLERFTEPVSLLLIDIDYFKKINDTYGHPVGDAVLKGVAERVGKTIRNIDIAARYGGEEFAVVLLGTEAKGAVNMAERLRKNIMSTKFSSEKNTFNVTVSIGIATFTRDISKKEELIDRADKALYHAKESGRNQSILWSEIAT